MRYPLDNWYNIQRGYTQGVPTFYSNFHLGVDYIVPKNTPIYAPLDGEITDAFTGEQGGHTGWFKFIKNKQVYVMRLLHLNKKPIKKSYKEGDIIAYTGNSGSTTTGPHLHLDISKNEVHIERKDNFVDPEWFFIPEYTHKILFIKDELGKKESLVNEAIERVGIWLSESTKGKLTLKTTIVDESNTDFISISGTGLTGKLYQLMKIAYVDPQQILSIGERYGRFDSICMIYNIDSIKPYRPTNPVHSPLIGKYSTPFQIPVFLTSDLYTIENTIAHELLHAFFYLIKERGGISLKDNVHDKNYKDQRYNASFKSILADLKPYWKFLISKNMQSNVKILIDSKSNSIMYAIPVRDESAMKSYGLNYGIEIPLNTDGSVDWGRIHIDGTVNFS